MGRSSAEGPQESRDTFGFRGREYEVAESVSFSLVEATGEETHLEVGLGSPQPPQQSQASVKVSEMGSVADLGDPHLFPVQSLQSPACAQPGARVRIE